MNTRKLDQFALVFVVFVLIALSCGLPRFMPEGVDLADELLQEFTSNVAGTYEAEGGITDLSVGSAAEDRCASGIPDQAGRKETLAFDDNKLIASDDDGERTYIYQAWGEFCRQLDDGKIECIHEITSSGYFVTVYDSKNELEKCFQGYVGLNPVDQPQGEEDRTEDDLDSGQVVENDEEQSEQQPESDVEPPDSVQEMDYNQTWDSGPLCGEEYETPYKWQVALIQSQEGTVNGTIRFHDCPGGGQVAYNVTGTPVAGEDFLTLTGTKAGGAGDLYTNSPETKYFIVRVGQPPEETSAP